MAESFFLQWHITARCSNRCAHCYLRDSDGYASEIENELSRNDCLAVIDDFHQLTKDWKVKGMIGLTGGDPLLRHEIFDLVEYASQKDISVAIMGNSEHLDLKVATKLKKLGISLYQVSIDGEERTHDAIRGKGSFQRTLEGIRILKQAQIPSAVMFTVSKQNADDLIPVLELAAREGIAAFDFSRLVPIGSGSRLAGNLMEASAYRDLLSAFLARYRNLVERGCETYFGRKDHLWKLLYCEMGLFSPAEGKGKELFEEYQLEGCQIGKSLLVIVADGTVYPCRRLPVKIGKVPDQNLKDIFLNSPELSRMRELERMEKCGKCELLQSCRGCPAVAYAVHGDYFSPDPQCWKEERR